ncbi:AP endonuclease 2 [Capronia epimyces CBS 606.96]|uniref:DNA-(apurinic or apyrimidinic site) endonuclease 2 n=1 Tax=Capronia epimyces CBS 606.96 TaxID=1182542 RepID=W9XZ75_9EURO|nr:AP endonuclease 2 [Capronia epimyces CBS 606.96]EXJ82281.1 AP endonuclease 2 [Capronia epimyces CBS 606.96]
MVRITTWNVNGIRNPFGYQPWRDKRTFEAMFDTLEADIVVFQETKIQRKDLRDDMVLVPGWDNYWSLPKHKKGYSGVVVYTRNATCAPIKAEEGITGILTPPNSSTSFRDLPVEEQIGGYPSFEQLSTSDYDPATLDAEGRCVILEFPAFVLIGTYCPAERDETRTHYRTSFLNVLDARIRNLVKMGKRVVWTGDMNISREQIDTAAAEDSMRKNGVDAAEWISTPARRMLNQLLVGGQVFGERDHGRETPVMWDVCRAFHEGRRGMYTCWETKVNARPGNYGARIDYIICSHDMKEWWSDSNIQEGLLGSDHCPVYAVLKDKVMVDGKEAHMLDLLNPPGMFENGVRQQPWSTKCLLALSGKLIPEFDKRQSIRDMFTRKPTLPKSRSTIDDDADKQVGTSQSSLTATAVESATTSAETDDRAASSRLSSIPLPSKPTNGKRTAKAIENLPSTKRSKSASQSTSITVGKGQQSLKGFFSAKAPSSKIKEEPQVKSTEAQHAIHPAPTVSMEDSPDAYRSRPSSTAMADDDSTRTGMGAVDSTRTRIGAIDSTRTEMAAVDSTKTAMADDDRTKTESAAVDSTKTETAADGVEAGDIISPAKTKQSWGKLFSRPVAPKCEHDEPCKIMVTKKAGVNCGRSFWMCNRPLGPSGKQEKGTQWRCNMFIWASDWDTHTPQDQ